MSSSGQIGDNSNAGYESTLHLVTHVPVPEGLEERVYSVLEAAPRRSQVLSWPLTAGWIRAVAAAGIVAVVVGGGWGVYRQAQLHQPVKVNAAPAPPITAPTTGGFSSAGAIRTPQTVKGPAAAEPPRAGNEGPREQGDKKTKTIRSNDGIQKEQRVAKPQTGILKNSATQ